MIQIYEDFQNRSTLLKIQNYDMQMNMVDYIKVSFGGPEGKKTFKIIKNEVITMRQTNKDFSHILAFLLEVESSSKGNVSVVKVK